MVGKLQDIVLPMIKLQERDNSDCALGLSVMRELLIRRVDPSLFTDEAVITELVKKSGGHPREMLRLLQLCCEFADERIGMDDLKKATYQLASDYRRFLTAEDYQLLVQIDAESRHEGTSAQIQNLLYKLALMEYNDGSWRRSHPVVRLLDGYTAASAG